MAYEIRTPILATVADKLMGVMNGVETDEIETGKANAMIRAGAGIRSVVETDLKVRLAAPKLIKSEAIDATPRPAALAAAA